MTIVKPPLKILAFDSWTGGAHHLEPIAEELLSLNCEILLLHVGSWGHDIDRPKEEQRGALNIRDISYYEGLSLDKILDRESPNIVVFLSTRAFIHQAFNRYARFRGIPTLHMAHGLIYVQDVELDHGVNNVNHWKRLVLIRSRLIKNLTRLLPGYALALLRTRASLSDWRAFATEIIYKISLKSSLIAPPDCTTTAGLVYVSADIPFLRDGYNVPANSIGIIGNPDLVRFGLKDESIGMCLNRTDEKTEKNVLYLDTALDIEGFVFPDTAAVLKHWIELKKALSHQGFSLLLKLHPARNDPELEKLITESGITLVGNNDFLSVLENVEAAISEPSTAGVVPALMGVPLFLPRFGLLNSQRYGPILTTYPLSQFLDNPANLGALTKKIKENVDIVAFETWSEDYIGKRPIANVAKRAAQAFVNLAKHKAIE